TLFALAGCIDGQPTPADPSLQACAPGQQIACVCPGGKQGAQACAQDGHGYGACDCGAGPSNPGDPGPSGMPDGGAPDGAMPAACTQIGNTFTDVSSATIKDPPPLLAFSLYQAGQPFHLLRS